MKTLYEILEVSETASEEIIEKAYKVLAKKYHPDLQPENQRQIAEQTMKQINEAYSILSDRGKRQEYDEKLRLQRQQIHNTYYEGIYRQTNKENENYQEKRNYYTQESQNQTIEQEQELEQKIKQDIKQQYEQKYQEAYEGYLRSLGYKVKQKWTLKRVKDLAITILVIIVICAILWIFPPTHKILVDFYESNPIIRSVINVIINVVIGIWNGICAIFRQGA